MTDKALAIYSQFDQLEKAAVALQASGYFKDVTSKAQAIVKVMAGAELGLPPFASMTGIHIIQGKPVLGANVIATLVKNDPRYNYRVKTATDTECIIEWLEDGKPAGTSRFGMDEAKTAGLTGKDNWAKYPSDMLFARAISRGARRFAPGIFGGSPIYTPDEMGADVDEEGNVIDTTARDVTDNIPDEDYARRVGTAELERELEAASKNNTVTVYQAVVSASLSESEHAARQALNLCRTGYDTPEKAISWMKMYRGWRDMGAESKKAADYANKGELPK